MRSTVNSLLNITFNKDITPDLNLLVIVGNEFNDSHSRSWTMTWHRLCCTRLAEYVQYHYTDCR